MNQSHPIITLVSLDSQIDDPSCCKEYTDNKVDDVVDVEFGAGESPVAVEVDEHDGGDGEHGFGNEVGGG